MKRTFALAFVCGLLAEPLFAHAHGMSGRGMGGAPAFQGHFPAPSASFAAPHSFASPPVQFGNVRHFNPVGNTSGFATTPAFHTASNAALPAVRNVSPSPRVAWSGRNLANIPPSVQRNWDRGRDHEWNHHHFRWAGSSWVLLDPYPYGYDYPDFYSGGYYPYPYVANAPDSLGAEVQEALARQGYYRGDIDGATGPATRDAIATFQRNHRLAVTGTITPQLLDSLGLE